MNRKDVVSFKRHAPLFTLLSALRTVFTLQGVFDPIYRIEVFVATISWFLRAVFVGSSIYFWMSERESVFMVQSDETGGD